MSLLAVLTAVSVAFAQRRPERREAEQRQERTVIERREREEIRQQQELAIAGRRNVLARMLDQLTAQARETEAVLRERGDAPGEEGHILRSELEALRDHIGAVERQLQELERREARRGDPDERARWEFTDGRWVPPTPTPRERERVAGLVRQLDELVRHRDELAEGARGRERELEGLEENQDQEAHRLQNELREIHDNMKRVESQIAVLSAEHAQAQQRRAMAIRELVMRERERAMAEGSRAQVMREREGAMAEGSRAQVMTRRMRELASQRRDLQQRAAEIERNLAERADSDEAQGLRMQLDETHEQLRLVQEQVENVQRERELAAQERQEVARRRGREVDALMSELAPRREDLRLRIEEIELKLRELEERGEGNSDESNEMRNNLREVREERRAIETRLRAAREERGPAEQAIEPGEVSGRRRTRTTGVYDEMSMAGTTGRRRGRTTGGAYGESMYGEGLYGGREADRRTRGRTDQTAEAPTRARTRATRSTGAGDEDAMVTKVYALRHTMAAHMARIIGSLTGRSGGVVSDERTNSLMVVDTADNLKRIETILQALDVAGAESPRARAERDPALETQVEELRGKVNGLHEQMQQMQKMLQQLLERTGNDEPSREPQQNQTQY